VWMSVWRARSLPRFGVPGLSPSVRRLIAFRWDFYCFPGNSSPPSSCARHFRRSAVLATEKLGNGYRTWDSSTNSKSRLRWQGSGRAPSCGKTRCTIALDLVPKFR